MWVQLKSERRDRRHQMFAAYYAPFAIKSPGLLWLESAHLGLDATQLQPVRDTDPAVPIRFHEILS